MKPIRFPEVVMTWPSMKVSLELAPWQWQLWFYKDWESDGGLFKIDLGPLEFEFSSNLPFFPKEDS